MDAQPQVPEPGADGWPESVDWDSMHTPEELLAAFQQLLREQLDEQDEALMARAAGAMIGLGVAVLHGRMVALLAGDA
jgi:hypothetical protein